MASNYNQKSDSSGSSNNRTPHRRTTKRTAGAKVKRTTGSKRGAGAKRGSGAKRSGSAKRAAEATRSRARRTARRSQNPSSARSDQSRQSRVNGSAPHRRPAARMDTGSDTASASRTINAVRLGDLQEGRGARMQSHYKRYVRRVLIAVGVLAAVVVIYAVLYFSGILAIKNVTVKGCSHLTAQEVSALAAVPEDSTLLRVDAAGICERLESNPWVVNAEVTPILPDTLELDITERTIDAVVDVTSEQGDTTESWAIASDGMWLMKIPDEDSEAAGTVNSQVYKDAKNVLHITGVPYGVSPEAGSYCTDDSVKNAVNIVSGLTTELADQVKSVKADSSDNATLTLDSGVEIAFGSATDIREKERISLQLIKEHKDTIAYINVRTPANPTWRSL